MRTFILTLVTIFLLVGCRKAVPSDPVLKDTDSVRVLPDTFTTDTTNIVPPKKADGLFDDFAYSFMKNPKFQRSRIVFPLPVNDTGKGLRTIDACHWRFDPMYLRQDVYTIIYDSEASTQAEKDTSLDSVTVEWVYLSQQKVKQYVFRRLRGAWYLTHINKHQLSENANSDFYRFYNRFSTNQQFQMAHVANPLQFKTYDEDNFQPIEGLLVVVQWPDFRPELPKGIITNINYGQNYADSHRRVLMICTPSGGMGCRLVFQQKRGVWKLVKYVN